jgi:hypothetical protein
MKCMFCKTEEPRADKKAKAILCGNCVAKLASPPAAYKATPRVEAEEAPVKRGRGRPKKDTTAPKKVASVKSTGFGRGWHLKRHFVAPDGTTYSFGKPL